MLGLIFVRLVIASRRRKGSRGVRCDIRPIVIVERGRIRQRQVKKGEEDEKDENVRYKPASLMVHNTNMFLDSSHPTHNAPR